VDVIAKHHEGLGNGTHGKAGFYFQHSYKPQSIFASFNSQVSFVDDANNPFDTGYGYANAVTGVFNTFTQANKYALPEWRYKNYEFYVQDNWRVQRKLTLDYGARFYYLTPQWDTTLQASNFLPDRFDPGQAARASSRRCALARRRAPAPIVERSTRQCSRQARRRRSATPWMRVHRASHAGSGTASTAPSRPARGSTTSCRTATRSRCRHVVGFVYDFTGEAVTIVRGGWGIFYDRPQGNMVFDMIANAPAC
jgi:hypothetical protein